MRRIGDERLDERGSALQTPSASSYYSDNRDRLIIISEQDVDLSLDRFTIDVRQAKGAYKGIRVKNALGKLFDLQRVQVVYSDGSVHNEDRQIDMYSGERSRPINETPDSRFIDQINITQEPGPGRGRLQVIGIQDDEGRRMDRSGRGGGAYSSSLHDFVDAAGFKVSRIWRLERRAGKANGSGADPNGARSSYSRR